jgi:hypothetical protein
MNLAIRTLLVSGISIADEDAHASQKEFENAIKR